MIEARRAEVEAEPDVVNDADCDDPDDGDVMATLTGELAVLPPASTAVVPNPVSDAAPIIAAATLIPKNFVTAKASWISLSVVERP